MKLKTFSPQIKSLGDGKAQIVFATMGVIDKDSDVTKPGFFGDQHAMLVGAHDWNMPTIGKAHVFERGNEAVADLAFNLDMASGKEWFSSVKFDFENQPAKQNYSYGFTILDGGSSAGDLEGVPVRYLQPLADGSPGAMIHEISPVLLGAGMDTRTLAAKGLTFRDEIAATRAQVKALCELAGSIVKLRAGEGRKLAAERAQELEALREELKAIGAVDQSLEALLQAEPSPEGMRLLLQFERTRARLAGVAA